MKKPELSFWNIWNMSFGFLGIQFGFALQGGFLSSIFTTLGAGKDQLPLLWLAAPLTGLIIQPIVGYFSDRTWSPRWGRRRPFFLIGAILSTLALFFVPHSPALWIAAGLLWVLDASINISMEPFRALVADKLHASQRSHGFVVQTLIIGIGTWVASSLPWLVSYLGVSDSAPSGVVPLSVKVAFGIGAAVFLLSVFYTVFTTSEYPPENMKEFEREKKKQSNFITDIFQNFLKMPPTMIKLGAIQFFSWFAFFCMWSLSNFALTEHVYNAPNPIEANYNMEIPAMKETFEIAKTAYQKATNSIGSYTGIYGLSSMAFALLLTLYTSRRRINRKYVHMVSLILGGIGFISMFFIPDPSWLALSFALIGIAWASILSMPYAMLAGSIDAKKMGLFMGLFNMFIVIPQIIASIGGINFLYKLFGEETIYAMVIAGISLVIAGLLNFIITNPHAITYHEVEELESQLTD